MDPLSVQDHVVHVTDDFLEFISEGALAIEVWGHRCAGTGPSPWQPDALQAKSRTLRDRYGERTHQRPADAGAGREMTWVLCC